MTTNNTQYKDPGYEFSLQSLQQTQALEDGWLTFPGYVCESNAASEESIRVAYELLDVMSSMELPFPEFSLMQRGEVHIEWSDVPVDGINYDLFINITTDGRRLNAEISDIFSAFGPRYEFFSEILPGDVSGNKCAQMSTLRWIELKMSAGITVDQ